MKNDIFPKVRKGLLNIDGMLNILKTEKGQKYLLHIRRMQKVTKLLTLKQKKQIDFQ